MQSNDWYRALAASNTELIAHGLSQVDGSTLIAIDGTRFDADVIILGTGFEIAEPPRAKRVFNKFGVSMAQALAGSPQGYLGTTVEGCPNAFLMFGPNIAVSSSAFIILEAQLTYIMSALTTAERNKLQTFEPKAQVIQHFNDEVQEALVLGRGGVAGAAWSIAALKNLELNLGWDARQAEFIVGTSAGAVLGALLSAGVSVSDLAQCQAGYSKKGCVWNHDTSAGGAFPPAPKLSLNGWRLALLGLSGRVLPFVAASGLLPKGDFNMSSFHALIDSVVPTCQYRW